MDLHRIAENLIENVNGVNSKENTVKVINTLKHIMDVVNNSWETLVIKDTNECLLFNNTLCDCGRKIMVMRHRDGISYDVQ